MYSFDSRVRYSECDGSGRLSLVSLVNYLQDCSIFHCESLGHGVGYLREHHLAWFISAWQIEIGSFPRFCDPITVSTWCYEATRTQAGRNFLIAAPDGAPYVRADSLWFTFDTRARRPVRIPDDEYVYLEDAPRLEMPPTIRKLEVGGTATEMEPIAVSEHHLDTNGHVNNAQYVAMAADSLRAFFGGTQSIDLRRVCVQYRQMALSGDVVVPRVRRHTPDGRSYTVELASPEGSVFSVVRLEG